MRFVTDAGAVDALKTNAPKGVHLWHEVPRSIWVSRGTDGNSSDALNAVRNVNLIWPHRDGLIWPHPVGTTCCSALSR